MVKFQVLVIDLAGISTQSHEVFPRSIADTAREAQEIAMQDFADGGSPEDQHADWARWQQHYLKMRNPHALVCIRLEDGMVADSMHEVD